MELSENPLISPQANQTIMRPQSKSRANLVRAPTPAALDIIWQIISVIGVAINSVTKHFGSHLFDLDMDYRDNNLSGNSRVYASTATAAPIYISLGCVSVEYT